MQKITLNEAADTNSSDHSRRANSRKRLESEGHDLFPAEGWEPSHHLSELPVAFEAQFHGPHGEAKIVRIAGRLVAKRGQGGVWFADLWQEHKKVQLRMQKDAVALELWELRDSLDIGDFLGVIGKLARTKRGELTVDVHQLQVLGKPRTTPAIGKKSNQGTRYDAQTDRGSLLRDRRHIGFLTNQSLNENIKSYALALKTIRAILDEEGYLEVQTSVMGRFYGGAAATPFTTRSKALNEQLYLRVSPEPDLKRLLVGGFDRVYEIGRNWRNEGVDATHQPSFTAMEVYRAWADYTSMMTLTERLVSQTVKRMHNSFLLRRSDRILNFEPPWPRHRMVDLVAEFLGLRTDELTLSNLKMTWCERNSSDPKFTSWGEYVVAFFEDHIEGTLIGPCFVIDYPAEGSPLTKRHRRDPRLVERFEVFVAGMELANAYSELNDPVEQRERLKQQAIGRDEHYGLDEYFLTAMDDGMPQAAGLGIGVDRLVMLVTGADRISDVIPFPIA